MFLLINLTFWLILDQLKQICKEYFDRMYMCESQKYDMEFEVRKRGFEVQRQWNFVHKL